MKFASGARPTPADWAHFLTHSATVMSATIVDVAHASLVERRGGGAAHVTLNIEIGDSMGHAEEEIMDVPDALEDLSRPDPRLARVVEMLYFCGITDAEIGAALGVDRTVQRDWEKARLQLASALRA